MKKSRWAQVIGILLGGLLVASVSFAEHGGSSSQQSGPHSAAVKTHPPLLSTYLPPDSSCKLYVLLGTDPVRADDISIYCLKEIHQHVHKDSLPKGFPQIGKMGERVLFQSQKYMVLFQNTGDEKLHISVYVDPGSVLIKEFNAKKYLDGP